MTNPPLPERQVIPDVHVTLNATGTVIVASPSAELLGITADASLPDVLAQRWNMPTGYPRRSTEFDCDLDGRQWHFIMHREAETTRLVGRDVTLLVQRLRDRHFHDPLTGCLNRLAFEESVAEHWQRATTDGHAIGILFVDVDRLKVTNDTLGHPAGDRIIETIGTGIRSALRNYDGDHVYRIGGDEFVAICHNVSEADLRSIERRIHDQVHTTITISPERCDDTSATPSPITLKTSATIGRSLITQTALGNSPTTLRGAVEAADRAMYEHKRARSQGISAQRYARSTWIDRNVTALRDDHRWPVRITLVPDQVSPNEIRAQARMPHSKRPLTTRSAEMAIASREGASKIGMRVISVAIEAAQHYPGCPRVVISVPPNADLTVLHRSLQVACTKRGLDGLRLTLGVTIGRSFLRYEPGLSQSDLGQQGAREDGVTVTDRANGRGAAITR